MLHKSRSLPFGDNVEVYFLSPYYCISTYWLSIHIIKLFKLASHSIYQQSFVVCSYYYLVFHNLINNTFIHGLYFFVSISQTEHMILSFHTTFLDLMIPKQKTFSYLFCPILSSPL
jgi:hypothetical protein